MQKSVWVVGASLSGAGLSLTGLMVTAVDLDGRPIGQDWQWRRGQAGELTGPINDLAAHHRYDSTDSIPLISSSGTEK